MSKRLIVLLYGVVAYVVFLGTFLYMVGFVANRVVPRTIDGAPVADFWTSLLVDLALVLLFAVQHSAMARRPFKRWLTRFIPEPAERSTYVLAASVALLLVFALWQPLGGGVWSVQSPIGAAALYVICALGWTLVLVSTLLLNHFDLFGLRQTWLYFRRERYTALPFQTPSLYRIVRHPLYVGFILALWATPTMTVAHLVFALATTLYILVAIQFEERDLVHGLGDAYREYRRRVPMLVPFSRRSS